MYIAGLVIPVPEEKMEACRKWAEKGAAIFKEYGCKTRREQTQGGGRQRRAIRREQEQIWAASDLIDRRIRDLGDWRGKALQRVREIIKKADPEIVEEWKCETPVWSHNGLVCTGETYKEHRHDTFAKGASLNDPRFVQLQS
jgi:hypothetical protein